MYEADSYWRERGNGNAAPDGAGEARGSRAGFRAWAVFAVILVSVLLFSAFETLLLFLGLSGYFLYYPVH